MSIAAGVVLKGQIVLERELGSGGMGAVWQAMHRGLNAPVAVKVLHAGHAECEEATARFAREAHATARIDSPHVVRVYDVGTTESGEPFLVMELLRGCDLKSHLTTKGSLSLTQAQLLLTQACVALGCAHELGIVHRDIKLANLFLCEGGVDLFVKVVDFGVAKLTTPDQLALTSTDALMGTPYYMSPEQFVSPQTVDHRSDLWSLAVVLYAALTGRLPFLADTVGGLTLAVHKGAFELPRSHRPALPAAVDDWFRRALATDRDQRFQSAQEMAQAFTTAIAPIPTGRATPPPSAPPATPTMTPAAQPTPIPPTAPTVAVGLPTPLAVTATAATTATGARPPWRWLAAGLVVATLVGLVGALLFTGDAREAVDDHPKSKRASARENVDLADTSVEDLYQRALRAAKKKNADVALTALSFTEVLPNGKLSAEGRFKVYFNTPTWKCVTVVMTSDGIAVDVSKCPKKAKLPFPKCSIRNVIARMKDTYPAEPTNMIYTRAREGADPQWLVSVAGKGGFVPDDC